MARTTKFSNARGCVAEPEVDPVLAVPRGERIQPDFERVHPPIIQDRIQHVTPPRSGSAGTHHLIPAQAVVTPTVHVTLQRWRLVQLVQPSRNFSLEVQTLEKLKLSRTAWTTRACDGDTRSQIA